MLLLRFSNLNIASRLIRPNRRKFLPHFCCYSTLGQKSDNRILRAYENFLEERFPRIYKVHRQVADGSKECWLDLKVFYKVSKQLRNGAAMDSFSRQELQIYIQMPKGLLKLSLLFPILFPVFVLPMGILLDLVLLCVVVLIFPRVLLTRHFWSKKQKMKFWTVIMQMRKKRHYKEIGSSLQTAINQTEATSKVNVDEKLSFDEIAHLAPHFCHPALQLASLPWMHRYHLSRCHSVLPFYGLTNRLDRRAKVVAVIDRKLKLEGLSTLSDLDLQYSCFLRQLDYGDMQKDEIIEMLKKWIDCNQGSQSSSYLLHIPILSQMPQ